MRHRLRSGAYRGQRLPPTSTCLFVTVSRPLRSSSLLHPSAAMAAFAACGAGALPCRAGPARVGNGRNLHVHACLYPIEVANQVQAPRSCALGVSAGATRRGVFNHLQRPACRRQGRVWPHAVCGSCHTTLRDLQSRGGCGGCGRVLWRCCAVVGLHSTDCFGAVRQQHAPVTQPRAIRSCRDTGVVRLSRLGVHHDSTAT